MSKSIMMGTLGGIMGFLLGAIGGGFLGMVIGGTFFGWLEIPNYPNMPGYELATYIGIILGVLIATPLGVIMALKIAGRVKK
jgi:integral membrane sensor domain MASE1